MNRPRKGVVLGAVTGLLGSGYVIWFSLLDRDYPWTIFAALYAAAVLVAAKRLWQGSVWGLRLSWLLALAGLGFGIYVTHFRWTFWLFEEPTLGDRVKSLFHPAVLFYLGAPALWLFYSSRPKFRSELRP